MPLKISYPAALHKLHNIQQQHLLQFWEELNEEEKSSLFGQIIQLDEKKLKEQRELLFEKEKGSKKGLHAFREFSSSGDLKNKEKGRKIIADGKVGCLVLAGGQGTRLGFDGPKGMFPVTPVKNKTLFQFLAERVVAAGKQVNRQLPLAILTSPLNYLETYNYFLKHQNFGLENDQLRLVCQDCLPFLDREGNLFLENKAKIAQGPDGNGGAFYHFYKEIWPLWKAQGVEYLNIVLIDNPLADPFDAELVGFHADMQADVTLKCTLRQSLEEKVGLVVRTESGIRVVEYSELPESERQAYLDGSLKHLCANLSLFCVSMNFIQTAAENYKKLPLHKALKDAKNLEGITKAWKFETFIFDNLALTDKIAALAYPREQCFAPLKNKQGEGSFESVQRALEKEAKRILFQITGKQSTVSPLELDASFYYPTEELQRNWAQKPIPNSSYIVP